MNSYTPYNANAEKRIEDLIKKAENGDDIFISNEILIEATDILGKEFNSHWLDSREVNTMRIKNKMRIYEKVFEAYSKIISHLPTENDFIEHDGELREI